jgi:hypothetical protein
VSVVHDFADERKRAENQQASGAHDPLDPVVRLASAVGNNAFGSVAREGAGILPGGRAHPDVERAIARTRGGGQPLPESARDQVAPLVGDPSDQVRVHTDDTADSLARSVSATAFTTGSDIYFARGRYAPGSSDGDRLLAHELTHVAQQSEAPASGPLTVSRRGDRFEIEADQASRGGLGALGVDRAPASPPGRLTTAVLQRDGPEAGVADPGVELGDAGLPPSAGVERPPHIDVVPPRAGDAADMDRAIREHFSNEEWEDAARILNGFSQPDIDVRVRGYLVGQRSFLATAASVNGAAADRIRKVAEFENALFYSQWEQAANALNGYPDQTRVEPRLKETEASALAWIIVHAERGSLPLAPLARSVATPRSPEMVAAFTRAVSTSDWDGAAVALNAMPDADLNGQLAVPPRTPPQLFDIDRRAVYWGIGRVHGVLSHDPQRGLIATEGLDRDLRRQIAAADWAGVTSTLERYNDDNERRSRLQWFHLAEVTALADFMRGGAVGVARSPVYPLVEARRVEKLGQEYTAAVANGFWIYAVMLLNAYNDADLLPKATEIQTVKGAAGITNASNAARLVFPDDNHRVRRILAFVPLQTQTAPAPASGSATLGAAAGPGVAVAGGTVTAYQGVVIPGATGTFFGFDYQGPGATNVAWIQFIAREGEKFDAAGNSLGFVDDTWTPTGQTWERQYSSPSNQRWYVDTVGGNAPFYDAPSTVAVGTIPAGSRGRHVTSATGTGMFDQPGLHTSTARKAFDTWFWEDDVDHVVMRAKFYDYLVRGDEVLYENTMTVSWALSSASATPSPTNVAGTGSTTSRMRDVHFRALLDRFPAWGFYRHE